MMPADPTPKTLRVLAILAIIAAIMALGSFAAMRSLSAGAPSTSAANPLTPDLGMDALSIPEFSLIDQNGTVVTEDDLLGRITILDFFFSRCPFICPPMSRNMMRCQDALAETGVQFMSISVDPDNDTPERLREYAAEIGADTTRWTFATGPRESVTRILTEGLLLPPPDENPEQRITFGDGQSMANIMHPSHFILIGPTGEIVALYNGLDRDQVDQLIARARAAAGE